MEQTIHKTILRLNCYSMQNLLFHAKGQACIGTEFLALQGTAQQDGLIGMRPNARC
jgi:hypothetical protein